MGLLAVEDRERVKLMLRFQARLPIDGPSAPAPESAGERRSGDRQETADGEPDGELEDQGEE